MPPSKSAAAKREYDKPKLKQQIDEAMKAFIHAGHEVERVAPLVIPEPLALVRSDGVLPQEALGGDN